MRTNKRGKRERSIKVPNVAKNRNTIFTRRFSKLALLAVVFVSTVLAALPNASVDVPRLRASAVATTPHTNTNAATNANHTAPDSTRTDFATTAVSQPAHAKPSTTSTAGTQAFGFAGYQRDRESGLYYANARYYDPTIAQFTSEDPELGKAIQPPSLHRYLYAYGNPTVYTDPSGRCVDVWCASAFAYAYAQSDQEREAIARRLANSDPTLGRAVGAVLPLASTANNVGGFLDDLSSNDPQAQTRIAQMRAALRTQQTQAVDTLLSFGGPAKLLAGGVRDFGEGIGTHAGQLQQAIESDDYVGQGTASTDLALDATVVAGAGSAVRGTVARAFAEARVATTGASTLRTGAADSSVVVGRSNGDLVFVPQNKPPVSLADVDSDFGPLNRLSNLAETNIPGVLRDARTGQFVSDPFAPTVAAESGASTGNRNLRSTQDPTIFYRIDVDGQGRKVGISSVPPNAAGEYSRPLSQVRQLEDLYGDDVRVRYRVRQEFENRADALDYEREFLDRFKRLFGQYPGEGLSGGNKSNH